MPGRAQAGEGDGQTVTVTRGIPRDIKGYQDRKGSALGQWSPQKKMTSSLPTSSLAVSGVVGSEGPGDAGGRDVLPDLKKASGGVVAGAGLGAGKQGSGAGADPWVAGRMGLRDRRFRDELSSLLMNLLRSSCCFRSKDAELSQRWEPLLLLLLSLLPLVEAASLVGICCCTAVCL